jgi:hypothetical protein
MEILLAFPEAWAALREQIRPEWLASRRCRAVFDVCCDLDDQGIPPTFDRLMTEYDDPAIKNMLVEYDESGQSKGLRELDYRNLLHDLIKNFQQKEIEKQRPANVVELRESNKDPREVMRQIIARERDRQGITKFTEEQGP